MTISAKGHALKGFTKLARLRIAMGMTQLEASRSLKVTPTYLSMVENGRHSPGSKLMLRMMALYNVDANTVMRAVQAALAAVRIR